MHLWNYMMDADLYMLGWSDHNLSWWVHCMLTVGQLFFASGKVWSARAIDHASNLLKQFCISPFAKQLMSQNSNSQGRIIMKDNQYISDWES